MGLLLLLPFVFIRFGLLSILSQEGVGRAAHFAPPVGREKIAYWVYQISNVAILVCVFFLKIKFTPTWLFCAGAAIYGAGVLLLTASICNFAKPAQNGFNRTGLYKFSRNPMYVSYFVFFLGYVALAQSLIFLAIVLVFQLSAHFIILSEERWCIQKFGDEYCQYMKQVRRYV